MENHIPTENSKQSQKTFKVTKGASLEEGPHTGTVARVEFRHDPYEYTDLLIAVDGWEFDGQPGELKYGVSTNFTENAQLIQLMKVFGKDAQVDEEFTEEDVKNVFLGKRVKFVVYDRTGKDKNGKPKTYSNIVSGSIKCI